VYLHIPFSISSSYFLFQTIDIIRYDGNRYL
jgi:hypothetical protein